MTEIQAFKFQTENRLKKTSLNLSELMGEKSQMRKTLLLSRDSKIKGKQSVSKSSLAAPAQIMRSLVKAELSEKVLTTEDRELQEIRNHGGFKAPFNKKLLTKVIGVPQVERIPLTTEFQEFKLRIPKRETTLKSEIISSEAHQLEECKKQFKARELNKKILLEAPQNLEIRKSSEPLVP